MFAASCSFHPGISFTPAKCCSAKVPVTTRLLLWDTCKEGHSEFLFIFFELSTYLLSVSCSFCPPLLCVEVSSVFWEWVWSREEPGRCTLSSSSNHWQHLNLALISTFVNLLLVVAASHLCSTYLQVV